MSESFNIHMIYQQINSRVFVLPGGPESRAHSNGLCVGDGEEGRGGARRKISGPCCYLLLHLRICNYILPGDYDDRVWIKARKATLIIIYLFSYCLHPSKHNFKTIKQSCQARNCWVCQNLTILVSRLLLVIRNEAQLPDSLVDCLSVLS